MIIIAGHELVNAEQRDPFVAASVTWSRALVTSTDASTWPSPPIPWNPNGSM